LKQLFKISAYAALLLAMVLGVEAVVFYKLLTEPDRVAPADVIAVFLGAEGRIRKGYALAEDGFAPYLILSPADLPRLSALDRRYATQEKTYQHLVEARAQTTFQNALLAGRLIRAHGLESCLLVTDQHHMPRSRILLRMALAGQGVNIIPVPVDPGAFDPSPLRWTTRQKKQVYNEMIKFWGSLAELVHYQYTGELPERSLGERPSVSFLRGLLLFDLDQE
jgi:hypothetical protein